MSTAVVNATNPGDGILVDSKAVGRPVGDTSSSAVFVEDLPKNFHGGDEALHFALGELFGQFGKIKKIELYMDQGILETENFKGEALVVYHKTKKTGTHDSGDPVYDACTELDGRFRVLGHRNWRIRCEAAVWQKEGYDVTKKVKTHPCVEISNLWEYSAAMPLSQFGLMQEEIRKFCAQHVESPFVKIEPSIGVATIWCKGAQDCMKLASIMHKAYFLGRKIVATLCRKEKPLVERLPTLPKGELSMKPGVVDLAGLAGTILPSAEPPPVAPEPAVSVPKAPDVESMGGSAFRLREGCIVVLKGLVARSENNGRRAEVVCYVEELQRYQVKMLDDDKSVKVKPENLEVVAEPPQGIAEELKESPSEEEEGMDAAEAEAMAAKMASGGVRHGPETHDPNKVGFKATVCVDPSLLPKKEEPEEAASAPARRDRSRSRERRMQERIEAAKSRLQAEGSKRPGWVVSSPQDVGCQAAATGAAGTGGCKKEPEQSREELLKMSVSKLKELLKEFGKSARGCLEKKDFVDRLKPN